MISTLKDLEKLLKLCRKQGVTELDLHGVSFKLGDLPVDQSQVEEPQVPADALVDISTEDLMDWSNRRIQVG